MPSPCPSPLLRPNPKTQPHGASLAILLLATGIYGCAGNAGATFGPGDDRNRDASMGSIGPSDECGNGIDDDGDSEIDEGCSCGRGDTQDCFTGSYATRSVGVCAEGLQVCDAEGSVEFGTWGSCEGSTTPSEEICDGLDNDCDGATDEECPCDEGQSQDCGVEFLIGPCTGGTQYCRSGTWTSCEGAVAPVQEACGSAGTGDGIDNDCDGETDELCGCEPSPEMCGDGYDNDCDGDIDEPACTTDIGTVGGDPPDAGGVGTLGGDPPDAGATGYCETDLPAPRLISPLSTSRVTRRTPTLEWELAAGIDGAAIQLCEDRACTRVIETLEAAGTTAQPSTDLRAGVIYWRAVGLKRLTGDTTRLGCFSVPSMVSPTWEFFTNRRSAPLDTSWGTVFDHNGDGYADLAVGVSCSSSTCAQHVDVFNGGSGGLADDANRVIPVTIETGFMTLVRGIGDVNGDGFADLAVGNPASGSIAAGTGRVLIYFGSSSGVSTTPDLVLEGEDPDNESSFGRSIEGVGDVDRDGYGDVIVGTSLQMHRAEAYVHFGGPEGPGARARTVLEGPGVRNSGGFGVVVAGVGDVNADGFNDVGVGGGIEGKIWLYFGTPTGIASTASQVVEGAGGYRMVGLGDANGDGYSDVATTHVHGGTGTFSYRVRVYLGRASGVDPVPNVSLSAGRDIEKVHYGYAISGLDVDGDGYWELVVGAELINEAFLYQGGPSGIDSTPILHYVNEPDRGNFGCAVGGADVDGDLDEDLLIGASAARSSSGTDFAGRVYLFGGSTSGVTANPSDSVSGPERVSRFGASFASAQGGG